jgi:hypothetical protein
MSMPSICRSAGHRATAGAALEVDRVVSKDGRLSRHAR